MSESTQKLLSFMAGIIGSVVLMYNFLETRITATAEAKIKLSELATRAYETDKQTKEDIWILKGTQDNLRREIDDARSRITLIEYRINQPVQLK